MNGNHSIGIRGLIARQERRKPSVTIYCEICDNNCGISYELAVNVREISIILHKVSLRNEEYLCILK
jgi:hypothetical protein